MTTMGTGTLVNCGHVAIPSGISTGYGTDADGYTFCFSCCNEADIAALAWLDEVTAYVQGDRLVNWPGGVLGRVIASWDSAPMYTPTGGTYRRRYVQVRDVHGTRWHGSGPADNGTYVRLRRKRL